MALTHGEKALIYLGRFNPVDYLDTYVVPFDLTQDGIAIALHISRAHASIVLKHLREKQMVRQRIAHQPNGTIRRYVYLITSEGQKKRIECLEKMEEEGLSLDQLFPQEPIIESGPDPTLCMAYNTLVDACSRLSKERNERYPNITDVTTLTLDALRILNNWATTRLYDLQRTPVRIRIEDRP